MTPMISTIHNTLSGSVSLDDWRSSVNVDILSDKAKTVAIRIAFVGEHSALEL